MLLPGIGVMSWKEVEKRVQWGTLLMFGIGISLGSTLLDTQAASWMANYVVKGFGLDGLPSLAIFAILAAFLIPFTWVCQCHCANCRIAAHPD